MELSTLAPQTSLVMLDINVLLKAILEKPELIVISLYEINQVHYYRSQLTPL